MNRILKKKDIPKYFLLSILVIALCLPVFAFASQNINQKINDFAADVGIDQPLVEVARYALAGYSANNITVSSFNASNGMGDETWDSGNNSTKSVTRTATLSGRMSAARSYVTINFSATVYDNSNSGATDEFFWFYANSAGFGSGDSDWVNVDGTRDHKGKTIYASKTNKTPTADGIGLYMAVKSGSIFNPIDSGFKNIYFLIYKTETAAPAVSVANNAYTSSNTFTIQDSQSGLYKYTVTKSDGTAVASYTNGSPATRVTGAQTVTLASGSFGRYTVYAEDNLGNSATRYVNYYAPTISVQAYYNGSINTTGGSVGATASGGNSQYTFTGAVGSAYTFYANPAAGYYLHSWSKTSGTGTYTKRVGSKTQTYTVAAGDAFTNPLYFDAFFETISTSSKTVTYNGSAQGVDTPTGLPSGLTYGITYGGSTTVPKNAGTYSVIVTIYYNSESVGSKTVSLIINPKQATITWSNTSLPYNGNGQLPTAVVDNLIGSDSCAVTLTGAGINVGSYTATITALGNANYSMPAVKTQAFTITKVTPTLTITNNKAIFEREHLNETNLTIQAKNAYNTGLTVVGTYSWANGIAEYPLASASGAYTITYYVSDTTNYNNASISATLSVTRYNPTITITAYLDGVINSSGIFALVSLDADSNNYQVSANGKTINDSFNLSATSQDGYYFDYWRKNSGLNVGNHYGNLGHVYTITVAEAYNGAPNIYFDAYFSTIAGSFETDYTYNADKQAPQSSNVSGYTVTNYYNGTATDGTAWGTTGFGSTTKPTKAGSYTLISKHVYTSTDNTLGTKTLPFAINKKELVFDWSNTSPIYHGYNQIPVATANNLFAGDTCAILVSGEQSQAGTYTAKAEAVSNANYKLPANVTTSWSILPKALPVGFWQSSIAASYTFTGSRLFPTPIVTDDLLGLLVNSKDYTVSYDENYSVTKGGNVYINGNNNYTGLTEVAFSITKAAHNVFFASLRYNSINVGLETLTPQSSEFEVAFIASAGYTGNYITVYGYTDAVHPDQYVNSNDPSRFEAKRLLFNISSNVDIQYITDRIVQLDDGKYYSETTARIYLSRDTFYPNATVQYGITTITLGAQDKANYNPNTINPINQRIVADNYEAELGNDTTPLQHRIFIKKNHIAGGSFVSNIGVTYGDAVFDIRAGLNSGLFDYTVTSSNERLLTVAKDDTNPEIRKAAILNAGEVRLNLFHPGVSDLDTPANSYVSVRAEIIVNINRAVLTVTPIGQTVVYGTTPYYDKTSFTYGGFKNSDGIGVIKTVNSGYNPSAMRDVGTYYLTASNVVLVNTEYQNYEFEYPESEGILIITPKTLYAQIKDQTRFYGEDNPIIPITYQGFISGESQDNAADFVPPVVDFNGIHSLTPKGSHTINLRGGTARNYAIDVSVSAKLTISPVSVKIELDNMTADYNAKSVFSQTPIVIGVAGGTIPLGYTTVYYLYGDNYSEAAPVNVGGYDVMIIYSTGGITDNYDITTVYFTVAVTINPIPPIFALDSIVLDYNTMAYGGVPAAAKVEKGVINGTEPVGTLSFLYGNEGGELTSTLPRNSGRYTVRAIYSYEEGTTDNYINGCFYDFVDAVTIQKVDVTIDLATVIAIYNSSDGITPDRVSASDALPHGVYGEYDLNKDVYPYELSYRYLIDGVWEPLPPFNAGEYLVEVTFTALFDVNYNDTVLPFECGVKIEGAKPKVSLETKEISYIGKRVAPNAALARGIEGGSVPTGSFQYLFARHGSNQDFDKDLAVINVNLVDGVNLGYDILVRYIAGAKDNYASYEERFDSSLIVLPVMPRITLAPTSVNFTGTVFDFSRITASVSGILNGSVPLGSLSYEFISSDNSTMAPPVDSGTYSVKVTFTPASYSNNNTHGNYIKTSGVFAENIVINKVSPVITIVPKTSDYTGYEVTISHEDGNIKVAGVSADYQPKGSLSIQYGLSNDEWSEVGPTESGTYKVRILYTATADENYTNAIKIFNNAIKVLNIPATFEDLLAEEHIFNGSRAAVSFKPTIKGVPGKGSISLSYRLSDKINDVWVSRAPSSVGRYDVRINYIATTKDNYKSSSQVFEKALVIKPSEIQITPIANQSKVYDNTPIGYIEYTVEGLMPGDSLIGSLTAGYQVNAGSYNIESGDLRIDTTGRTADYANNYIIVISEGGVYDILQAEVELKFNELSAELSVYRPGDKKSDYVKVSATKDGKSVPITVKIDGDDINVGSFMAKVSLEDNNYALPAVSQKEYYITAADMDGFDNIFVSKTYSYSGKTYIFAADRVLDEATVVYQYNGESQDNPFQFTTVGEYTITATISKDNYNTVSKEATITIIKAKPAINALPYTGKLAYGDALPTIACDNENGTITLDKEQQLIPGTYDYTWTFIPDDQDNYVMVTGKIVLTVDKAATSLLVNGNSTQNASNPTRFSAKVASTSGVFQGNVDIKYYDKDGNVYALLPSKAGKYTLVVTFNGDEHYNASSYSETIIVEEEANFTWLYILIGAIVALGLIGGIASAARRRS